MKELLEIGNIRDVKPEEVLILGKGLIGSRLAYDFGVEAYDITTGFDITNYDHVRRLVAEKPQSRIIVNATGITNVDGIQKDEQLRELAFRVNVTGNENIARVCLGYGKYAVFISSETCFGKGLKGKSILEMDIPEYDMDKSERSVYGTTKARGELVAHNYFTSGGNGLILRIEYPSDKDSGYANKVIGFNKLANDIEISPTLIREIPSVVALANRTELTAVVLHCVGTKTTPYEFGLSLRVRKNIGGEVIKINSTDLIQNAPRPQYGVLDRELTEKRLGIRLRTTDEQIDYLTS